MKSYTHHTPVELESHYVLPNLTIAYHTYGTLNAQRDNVIWICHALTANADAQAWWPNMIGEGAAFDTAKYFVVCANILGSCYGTTGPLSNNPTTGAPYYSTFPFITIRDMVTAHRLLAKHLNVTAIELLVGGSMGGYQALEWALAEPSLIKQLFLLATSASESAWGIAIHTAQRLAIEADNSWGESSATAGQKGLKAARAIGMVTYRSYDMYKQAQTDPDINKVDHLKASSYINYQGDKLVKRFNAYSYWLLTKAMDSHNIARGRNNTIEKVLATVQQRTLVMAISSDFLCPPQEQQFIATHLPSATYVEIESDYGHDGFLVEHEKITSFLNEWLYQQ